MAEVKLNVIITILSISTVYSKYHPETFLNTEQKIRYNGYPAEVYQVETEDGYLIPFYRVPYSPYTGTQNTKNKSIVILMHGMGGCPENFMVLGRNSLPYYFADRGLDVWLFSSRGTPSPFKKVHKYLEGSEDPEYWKYSCHDVGIYDLSASIDFALNHTDQKKVFLVGHSAGGTDMYSLLAEKPEYNNKVKIGVSWGNAVVLKRFDFPLGLFCASLGDLFKGIVKYLNMGELFPQLQILRPLMTEMCTHPEWITACIKTTWFIGSQKSYILDPRDIGVMATLAPPRVSVKQAIHYMDHLLTGRFQKFDYGTKENMKRYGSRRPPLYNTSAITAPIAFFYGKCDSFFLKGDYYESAEILPNVVEIHEVAYKKYTHADFILSRNSTYMSYEPTYNLFKNYDNGIIPPRFIPPTNYT